MAIKEHVAQLKCGVEEWNLWRKQSHETPNLRSADLSDISLPGVNLSGADLSGVDFHSANLDGADLIDAICTEIDLSDAVLSNAKLHRANLDGANLSRTDFHGADLSSAILRNANLYSADLSEVKLICAELSKANLTEAVLFQATLIKANLSTANLSRAKLTKASLNNANLTEADLSYADFSCADLRDANLNGAQLYRTVLLAVQALCTNFHAARLTGACIEDWNTNSHTNLQDVVCEFIFLRYDSQQNKLFDRRPHASNIIFKPGEFAALVQKSLETVDLIFLDGIDWKALLDSLEDLKSQYGDELSVQGVEKKAGGAFLVRLEVPPESDKGEIERAVKEGYETKLQFMEAKYRAELQELKIQHSTEIIALYRQHNADMTEITKRLADKPITVEAKALVENNQALKYDLRESRIGNLVDTAQSGSRVQAIQHNYASEAPSLAEAAAEIQKLLQQLEQSNPDATEEEQKAFVNAMTPKPLRQRAVSALVAGGAAALVELPYGKVVKAIIEGWLESGSGGRG